MLRTLYIIESRITLNLNISNNLLTMIVHLAIRLIPIYTVACLNRVSKIPHENEIIGYNHATPLHLFWFKGVENLEGVF